MNNVTPKIGYGLFWGYLIPESSSIGIPSSYDGIVISQFRIQNEFLEEPMILITSSGIFDVRGFIKDMAICRSARSLEKDFQAMDKLKNLIDSLDFEEVIEPMLWVGQMEKIS